MIRIFHTALFIIGILALNACKPNNDANTSLDVQLVDSLVFPVGMSYYPKHAGFYYDIVNKKDYYYFANVASDKLIKFYDSRAELNLEIPLIQVTGQCSTIDNFAIFSLDTIVVLCSYSNELFFINRQGEIWKKLQLDSLPNFNKLDYFEAKMSSKALVNKNSLLLQLEYIYSIDDSIERAPSIEYYQHYSKASWEKPMFLYVRNIFEDSIQWRTGLPFYQELAPEFKNNFFLDFGDYVVVNQKAYKCNLYNDIIYEIDAQQLEITSRKEVDSTQNIGMDFTPINESTVKVEETESSANYQKQAIISGIHYNDLSGHFYVSSLAEYDGEGVRQQQLYIYNEKWIHLGKWTLDRSIYNSSILPAEKGFMLQKKSSFTKYKDQKAIYHVYQY